MSARPAKTKEEARIQLAEACASISVATDLIRPHLALFEQFRHEVALMESAGPTIDPTLFTSSERRATEAFLKPIFEAARQFVQTVDAQKTLAQTALDLAKKGKAQ